MKKTIYILHEDWDCCNGRESNVEVFDNKLDALKYIRREFDNDWCLQSRHKDFKTERTDTEWYSYDDFDYEFYRINLITYEVEMPLYSVTELLNDGGHAMSDAMLFSTFEEASKFCDGQHTTFAKCITEEDPANTRIEIFDERETRYYANKDNDTYLELSICKH